MFFAEPCHRHQASEVENQVMKKLLGNTIIKSVGFALATTITAGGMAAYGTANGAVSANDLGDLSHVFRFGRCSHGLSFPKTGKKG